MSNRLRTLLRRRKEAPAQDTTVRNLPRHIAIIMDGNGRWASVRGLPRTAGHRAGMEALRRTVRHASELGIKVLTVYAFSTENWRRPQGEVDFLMRLPDEYLKKELAELKANNVQLRMIGSMEGLPAHTREAVRKALVETEGNTGMVLNFALNYGSRAELVRAVQQISGEVSSGRINQQEIDEKLVETFLYTRGLPDPDLLIRPSGETRLSNFMLWQLAYAELWFSDVFWPDFDRHHLIKAIEEYGRRDRRYGGIKL